VMLSLVVLLTVACGIKLSDCSRPAYPLWPSQFTQNFTDYNEGVTGYMGTGATFFYDWTNTQSRLDRENGRYDRYCGNNGNYGFKNTPCSQIVTPAGDRYLYYPEKADCCFCCDAAHGCGVVIPTWLNGAAFLGNVTLTRTKAEYETYYWDQVGNQDNYYWETEEATPVDRIMLQLYEAPIEHQVYAPFRLNSVDQAHLALPSICSKDNACSILSVCAAVQGAASAPAHIL
jgi:hypothetical protein